MAINIFTEIERLLQYGLQRQLIEKWDVDFARNQILDVLGLEWEETLAPSEEADSPVDILGAMLDWAEEQELIPAGSVTYRDLLDTKIMGCLVPRPSSVNKEFYSKYNEEDPEHATDYFYQLSKDTLYIRTDRIAKNQQWFSETDYGKMEITINLSKPEKDPTAIAASKNLQSSDYPKCLLCKENVGYAGRINHPARQSHRIIPVEVNGETWYLQYSPYLYYNEHSILLSEEHRPMKISKDSFDRLLHFAEQFPHYFIGSNADLPIVGGSILSHDHFQAGRHEFPMAQAPYEEKFSLPEYPGVEVGLVRWPMSVIRLKGEDRHALSKAGGKILESWKIYSDEEVGIFAESNGERHNTVTPIARFRDGKFELDLVLRNNRTSDEHPLGIFHPHQDVHHIKKENIGLIEVMGLAVLPGRLKEEMSLLAEYLRGENPLEKIKADELTEKHADWAASLLERNPKLDDIDHILKEEVGRIFARVLEDAGVFKRNEQGKAAFLRFVRSLEEVRS
jgi:UDPglucose--hexose-1-phosphate uridylyltransferase